jgi:hypothetical protein
MACICATLSVLRHRAFNLFLKGIIELLQSVLPGEKVNRTSANITFCKYEILKLNSISVDTDQGTRLFKQMMQLFKNYCKVNRV